MHAQDFAPEELVFREPPLVGAQHTVNRADALVCSRCFTIMGSIEKQLAHRLRARAGKGEMPGVLLACQLIVSSSKVSHDRGMMQHCGMQVRYACITDLPRACVEMQMRSHAGGPDVNPDYLRSLWLESIRLPYTERFPLPPLVRAVDACTHIFCHCHLSHTLKTGIMLGTVQVYCLGGCTDAVYCSEACAQTHWAEQHELLCSGPSAAAQPQPAAQLRPQSPQEVLLTDR